MRRPLLGARPTLKCFTALATRYYFLWVYRPAAVPLVPDASCAVCRNLLRLSKPASPIEHKP